METIDVKLTLNFDQIVDVISQLTSNEKLKIRQLLFSNSEEEKDWYDDLTPEQIKDIEIGRADFEVGRTKSHQEVKTRIRELLESKKSA